MTAYRSDFLHAWVVGSDLLPESATDALLDLEQQALEAAAGSGLAEGSVLPLPVHQFFTGLTFVRQALWGPWCAGRPPALLGLIAHEDRIWALASDCEASLEQLTGAPVRFLWHEWGSGSRLLWTELDPAEAWRLGIEEPALCAHYRPALEAVAGEAPHPGESAAPAAVPELELPRKVMPAAEALADPAPRPAIAPALAPRARPMWLAAARGRVLLTVAACSLIALAAAAFFAREPIARIVVGEFELGLTTAPAGATVRVDGELLSGRTPLVVPLEPGAHRIELAYGEYANAVFSVEGRREERIDRSVAWAGSLGIASADTSAGLQVSFDGRSWGALPMWKDDVPVGRHRLSFHGEGVRPWEEEVQIRAGQSTRVTAEPVRIPPYGLVTARAERVTSEGVEDVDGAPVFVDGVQAGVTPTDLKLDPGPHSVRIRAGEAASPVHLIDVQAGGRYFASTQFGRPAEPWVAFDPPQRLSIAKPLVLTVALAGEIPLPVREMWLWRRAGKGEYERFALSIIQIEGRTRGSLPFPTAGLAPGTRVSYYVAIKTREGEEYFSEVRTVPTMP